MTTAGADQGTACDAPFILRRLPADEGCCYLTFDDGPDPRSTPAVLEALAAAGARATFFVIGRLALRHRALLRELRGLGHSVGNHSYAHRHPWTLLRAAARSEVRDGAAAIADVLGERPGWYRPPHGRLGPFVAAAVREEGARVALWSRSAVDWGPFASAGRILARLDALCAGDIVLMHDGPLRHNRPEQTRRALPALLSGLARHGLVSAPLPAAATMAG